MRAYISELGEKLKAQRKKDATTALGGMLPGWTKFNWSQAAAFFQTHRKALLITLVVLLGIGAMIPISQKIYRAFFVDIMEFTPQGEVSDRATLRLTFSDAIKIKSDLRQLDCHPGAPGHLPLGHEQNPDLRAQRTLETLHAIHGRI